MQRRTVLAAALVLVLALPSFAVEWNGVADGNWANTANWTGGALPTSLDAATFVEAAPFRAISLPGDDSAVADALAFADNYTLSGGDLTLTGGNITVNATFTATIGSELKGAAVAKLGAGTLDLLSANSYTGGTTLDAGTLRLGNNAALGAGALTIAGSNVVLASTNATARSLANNVILNGDVVFGQTAGGTGSLTLTGTVDLGFRTMRLLQDVTMAGVVGNGGLTKTGPATLTLTNDNTYTGSTTVNQGALVLSGLAGGIADSASLTVNAGATLRLDNTAAANHTDRLGDYTPLTLYGGAFQFANDAGVADFSENLGNLTLGNGAATIQTSQAASGRTATLNFYYFSRFGGTLNFSGVGLGTSRNKITFTSAPVTTDGAALGGWATAGSEWAKYTNANGIMPTAAGDYITSGETTWTASDLVKLSSGTTTLTADRAVKALTFAQTAATNIDLAGHTLLLDNGGLMINGDFAATIDDGALASNTPELFVYQNSASTTTIGALLSNNPGVLTLNKLGGGTLILGNAANSFSGGVKVFGGKLGVAADSALGNLSAVTLEGGTLLATAGFTSARDITLNGGANGFEVADGTLALTGQLSGDGGFTKTGPGTLTLSNNNYFKGNIAINGGVLSVASLQAMGDNSVPRAISIDGGTLRYTASFYANANQSMVIGAGGATIDYSGYRVGFPGDIRGSGTLTKTGSGTLALFDWAPEDPQGNGLGNPNFSGNIVIRGGAIWTPYEGKLGNGNLEINGNIASGAFWQVGHDVTRSLGTDTGQVQLTGGVSGFSGIGTPGYRMINLGGIPAPEMIVWGSTCFKPDVLFFNGQDHEAGVDFMNPLDLNTATERTIRFGGKDEPWGIHSVKLSGVISNSGGDGKLILEGMTSDNFMTLAASNTFKNLDVRNGGVLFSAANNLGQANNTITLTTGKLWPKASMDLGATRTITVNAATPATNFSQVEVGDLQTLTISGPLNGAGNLEKLGLGTLALSGAVGLTGQLRPQTGVIDLSAQTTPSTALQSTIVATKSGSAGTFNLGSATAMSIGGLAGDGAYSGFSGLDLTVNTAPGVVTEYNGTLNGLNSFTKDGDGIQILRAASGLVNANSTLKAGTLRVGNASALGTGTLTITGAATLASRDGTDYTLPNNIVLSANPTFGEATGGTGKLTFNGTFDLGGAARTLTINNPSNKSTAIAGVVSNGSLVKAGDGILDLTGATNAQTSTTINAGTLRIGNAGALGAGTLTVAGPSTIAMTDGTARTLTNNLVLNADVILGQTATGTGNITFSGSVDLGAGVPRTIDVPTSRTMYLTGAAGNGALAKAGAGTLHLDGSNPTISSVTINAGTVYARNVGATTNDLKALGSGLITLNSSTLYLRANVAANGGTIPLGNNLTASGTSILNVDRHSGTFTGGIFDLGQLKLVSGKLSINPGNSYAARFTSAVAAGDATLEANTVVTIPTLTVDDSVAADTTTTVTLSGSTNQTTTSGITGVASDNGARKLALAKTGTGIWVLSGDQAYSGGTTISAGTITARYTSTTTNDFKALGSGPLTLSGGTLQLRAYGAGNNGTISVGPSSTALLPVTVNGNATVNVDRIDATGSRTGNTFALGTLQIGANTLSIATANSYAVSFGATTLVGNATFDNAASATAGLPSLTLGAVGESGGARSLTKTNTGILKLTAANTYTGGTTVNRGVLLADVGATLGANVAGNDVIVANDGKLTVSSGGLGNAQQFSFRRDPYPTLGYLNGAAPVLDLRYDGLPTIAATSTSGVVALSSGTFATTLNQANLKDSFLGAAVATTYSASALDPGSDNVYRLGGGGAALTISSAVLTDTGKQLVVGATGYNGLTPINSNGIVVLEGANNYTGATTINLPVTGNANAPASNSGLTVSGVNGSIAASSSYTINSGSLVLNNAAGNVNRLKDDSPVAIRRGGTFLLVGNASQNTSETVGTVTIDAGQNTIALLPGTGRTVTLAAAGLARTNNATVLLRGNSLGATGNTARVTLASTTGLTQIGKAIADGGAATTLPIVPYLSAAVETAGTYNTTGASLVTYDAATGLRALSLSTEYAVLSADYDWTTKAAPENVLAMTSTVSTLVTLTLNNPSPTVNALLFNDTATLGARNHSLQGAGTLSVKSGVVAALRDASGGGMTATLGTVGSSFGALTLGNDSWHEGVIMAAGPTTLTINTPVNVTIDAGAPAGTTGGLTVAAGNYNGNNGYTSSTVKLNAANLFTGPLTLNAGNLELNVPNGTATNQQSSTTINGGVLKVTGTSALPNNGALGGSSAPININSTGTLAVSIDNTMSPAFGGGQINLNDGGSLTLTLTNTTAGGTQTFFSNRVVVGGNGYLSASSGSGSGNKSWIGPFTMNAGAMLTIQRTASDNFLGTDVVTLNGNATFNVLNTNTANTVNFAKVTGTGDLIKRGIGDLWLATTGFSKYTNAASDYTGATRIEQGKLRLGMDNALPTGTTVYINTGATLDLSVVATGVTTGNFSQTVAGLNDGSVGGGTVTANSSTTAITGVRTLTLESAGSYAFSGAIVDRTNTGTAVLGLTKSGSGTQMLSGANSYSGPTAVNDGKLLVNGTSTGTGAVSVGATATLGGTGSLAGAVTVDGKLTGADLGTAGTLSINNALTFNSTASAVFDIASLSSFDRVTGVSTLTYGGRLKVVVGTATTGVYDLFDFATKSGTFTSFDLPTLPTGYSWKDYGGVPFDYATGRVEMLGPSVGPLPRTWSGLGAAGNSNIGETNNWDTGAPVAGDDLIFSAGNNGKLSPINEAARTVGSVTFNTAGYDLTGSQKLTVGGPVTANANATISAPLELTGAGSPLAAASGATLTVSGSVSGENGLTKTGPGLVELMVSNSYTGNTTVAEGTLKVVAGIDSNGNGATTGDDTSVGTAAAGLDPAKIATLITEHIRQDTLTINAGSKVTINAASGSSGTSVVNFLNIASSSGTFNWSSLGGGIAPAATGGSGAVASGATVPEPATWLLAIMAGLAGVVVWRRRK